MSGQAALRACRKRGLPRHTAPNPCAYGREAGRSTGSTRLDKHTSSRQKAKPAPSNGSSVHQPGCDPGLRGAGAIRLAGPPWAPDPDISMMRFSTLLPPAPPAGAGAMAACGTPGVGKAIPPGMPAGRGGCGGAPMTPPPGGPPGMPGMGPGPAPTGWGLIMFCACCGIPGAIPGCCCCGGIPGCIGFGGAGAMPGGPGAIPRPGGPGAMFIGGPGCIEGGPGCMLRPKPPGGPMPGPGPWPCIATTYPCRSQAGMLLCHNMLVVRTFRSMSCWRCLPRSARLCTRLLACMKRAARLYREV